MPRQPQVAIEGKSAALLARAECLQVAASMRKERFSPEDVVALADFFWLWVNQGAAENRDKPAR